MAAAPASRGIAMLWKRGWNQIPEVMGSSCMALIGVGLTCTALYLYKKKGPDCRKHKFEYIVVRPGDPRAPKKTE